MGKLIDDYFLQRRLEEILENTYPDTDVVVNNMKLAKNDVSTDGTYGFTLSFDTNISESLKTINLTNMPIKQSTVKQLREDQKKHGFKSIETMIASVLEKHYDSI